MRPTAAKRCKGKNFDVSVLKLSCDVIDDHALIHGLGKATVSVFKKKRYLEAKHLPELTPNDLDFDVSREPHFGALISFERYFRDTAESADH